jgi:hypothetical protein
MISRLIGAYFSPLRDPFHKDWIFYVFLFLTIPSVLGSLVGGLGEAIISIPLTLGINWCIFIFGLSWIRSFGMSKYTIGISPKFKSADSLDFPVTDVSDTKIEYKDIQDLVKKFTLKSGEKMEMFQSNNNRSLTDHPDFKNWIESTFLWDMMFKPGEVTPMIFGPIWFSCSEVKQKVPANLCLMTTGEIGITWRKNTNSLLDYWLTHTSEISGFRLIDKFTLELEIRTVNRVIGKTSGLRKAEVGTLELRVGKDGHANRRALTTFYSFIANLN